jgi:DNA repair ATPase RecN
MTKEDKDLQDQEAVTGEQTEPQEDQHEKFKATTEKLWGSTKQAWNSAAFKANQYKKLVQKKIDLSALHKKINAAHADLGKVIDDLHDDGKKNIMNLSEVKEILARLDELKAEAAILEEEVEQIRAEGLPQGDE